MNFIFVGNPGSGKTTAARGLAQALRKMGVLATDSCTEVSIADLMTGYKGQAEKRTRDTMTSARGGVLFIDNAHRLNDCGNSFGNAILGELVYGVTKPEFQGKLAIVLAGYPEPMREMLELNPGLSSRFSEVIRFEDFDDAMCIRIFRSVCEEEAITLASDVTDAVLASVFARLRDNLAGYSNGRDVHALVVEIRDALTVSSSVDMDAEPPATMPHVHEAAERMLRQRPKALGGAARDPTQHVRGPASLLVAPDTYYSQIEQYRKR